MNKSIKIFIAVFILLLSKVVVDIPLLSQLLVYLNQETLFNVLLYASVSGIFFIFLFNKLQQHFPFLIAVIALAALFISQQTMFFVFKGIYARNYFLFVFTFSIAGNIAIFHFIKNLGSRLSDENSFGTDRLMNYAKHCAFLCASVLVLIISLRYNILDLAFYQKVSGVLFWIAFPILISVVINYGNEILENPQQIKVRNKLTKLIKNPFFIILLITALVLGLSLTFSYKLFIDNSIVRYSTPRTLYRLLGFFILFISLIGIPYELFLRQRLILYIGIKNSILFYPIVSMILAISVLANTLIFRFPTDSDSFFIFLVLLMFIMGIAHFSFEHISVPTTYSFYLPIGIEIRNDFYSKSFLVGILCGIVGAAGGLKILNNSRINIDESMVVSAIILFLALVLYLLNNWPVFRNYKIELQNYLDVYSRNIIINKGLFKDLEHNNPDQFTGTQFIRYINLMYLINPELVRDLIASAVNSMHNFNQRVGVIKGEKLYMMEILPSLKKIRSTKYFQSSPNRDKIESALTRFYEIQLRIENSKFIQQLSISKKSKERVLGAKLLYYAQESEKKDIISRLLRDPEIMVVLGTIISSSKTNDKDTIKDVAEKLSHPALSNAAYASLYQIGDSILPVLEEVFYETGQSERVLLRIIQLYGDLANETATEFLLKKLNSANQNIISAALNALSKCSVKLSEDKTTMLQHELQELCRTLTWNLMYDSILSKENCSSSLIESIKIEIDGDYDKIFNLLALLYDAKSIQLIQNNLFSKDLEKINFAIELASVLIHDELKLMILPFLQPVSTEEKVSSVQNQFPTEKMNKLEILYFLIQRESKWINQWTKACAIAELIEDFGEKSIKLLLANMVNPDIMIGELATKALFDIDKKIYLENKAILDDNFANLYSQEFIHYLEDGQQSHYKHPVLKYDIIKYLQEVPEFSTIPGEILKRLTDQIIPLEIKAGEIIEELTDVEIQNYFYVLYSGKATLLINNEFVCSYGKTSLISTIDLLPDERSQVKLYCEEDSIIYRISPFGLIELLTFHDIIPESILKQTLNKEKTQFEDYVKRKTTFKYIPQNINELFIHHTN